MDAGGRGGADGGHLYGSRCISLPICQLGFQGFIISLFPTPFMGTFPLT